jgi:hypothetical protein
MLTITTNTPVGGGCPNIPGVDNVGANVYRPTVSPINLNASISPICNPTNVILSQAGGSLGTGATWRWYSDPGYTNFVGTGSGADASLTVSPIVTTTYYLRAEGGSAPCPVNVVGPSAGVTVTVNQPSIAPSSLNATPNPVCSGTSITLTQTGGTIGTGALWRWYSDPAYTNLVGTGSGANASLTVNPTSNTTYYLRAEGGTSPCLDIVAGLSAGVAVIVNQPSTAPVTLNSSLSTICNGNSVTLTQTGGNLGSGATWSWYSDPGYTNFIGLGSGPDAS